MSPSSPLRFSHYRVLEHPDGGPWKLGAGAMGETYKAYDERLRVVVALKVITPTKVDDAATQALFLREARAAARVRHPNVASVLYLNDTPGNFFYAMEFIEGQSLQEFLRVRGRLPPATALSIAAQAAHGLAAIHARGIVHRDLKPANLMLVPSTESTPAAVRVNRAENWQIKVIDFGLARTFFGDALGDESAAHTVGFRGTVLYASPEQCEERIDLDGRSDQYSLGCILWEMLLGAPPFAGKSHAVMTSHVSRQPPLEALANLPIDVQSTLARMLAKEPARRFAGAEDLARELEECCGRLASGDDPMATLATPKTRATQAPRWSSWMVDPSIAGLPATTAPPAHRPLRAVIAGVALIAISAAGGWLWARAHRTTTPPGPAAIASRVVSPPRDAATAPDPAPRASLPIPEKSIAVLPFDNLSEDKQSEYFAGGMQDEILTDLAKVADLKVISRSSVMQYKGGVPRNLREIGPSLGVAHILEGSVQRAGNRIRVHAKLIDLRTDAQIWAERYERDLVDIFAIQTEISEAIVRQLQAKLPSSEKTGMDQRPTSDLRAYELYLKARDLMLAPRTMSTTGKRQQLEAVQFLTEATARDSNFFAAYCLLTHFHDALYWFGGDSRPERLALAQASLDQAARLRPGAPELHLARARHLYWGSRDYERASEEINEATKFLPNDADALALRAYIDRRKGRFADAAVNLSKATETNPGNLSYWGELSDTYAFLGQAAEFFRVRDQIEERNPSDPALRINRAGTGTMNLLGDPKPLRDLLEDYRRVDPALYGQFAPSAFFAGLYQRDATAARHALEAIPATGITWYNVAYPREYFEGVFQQYFGERDKAAAAFAAARRVMEAHLQQTPNDPKALIVQAEIDAYLGRHDEALREGRRALEILSPQNDAIDGARLAAAFARVSALGPDRDQAVAALRSAAASPAAFFYGPLLLHPVWDPIRDDPAFAAVVAKLAPKGEAR